MNDFNDSHVPTPEFRASLKSELRRAYRAERQFGATHAQHSQRVRRLGIVVGLVAGAVVTLTIGLVLGAATGYASAEELNVRYQGDTAAAEPRSALAILRALPVRNALSVLSCGTVTAAPLPPAQQGIPVVNVAPPAAKTTTTLGAVLGVRELPGGRLLVNDAGRRQIKIFDSTLANETVALDSAAGASNSYGPRPSNIFAYLGDSTAFTEMVSQSVLVLDRNGQVARALAPPAFQDVDIPFPVPFPVPSAIDDKGRLLAHGGTRVRGIPGTNVAQIADSSLIYRADLDSRQVDVVGVVHSDQGKKNRSDPPENGNRVVTSILQPVPTEDSWSVLSDGTIAFVRGRDYHVDWILPDGTKSSTTKLPFDWKRLTDEDKQKLVDSARVVWDSLMAIRNARNATPSSGRGGDPGGGEPVAGRFGRSSGGAAAPGQQGSIQRIQFVPLSEIPDYYPPIRRNSAMSDLDGNLWILPNTSAQSQHGELVYDVVNPKKGLFQRVRMPVGRSIAGFGKGGVVYLQSGDRANGFYLERVKLDAVRP